MVEVTKMFLQYIIYIYTHTEHRNTQTLTVQYKLNPFMWIIDDIHTNDSTCTCLTVLYYYRALINTYTEFHVVHVVYVLLHK